MCADVFNSDRSNPHNDTVIEGKLVTIDWHVTLAYKTDEQVKNKTHVACHAYMKGMNDFTFTFSTAEDQKSDTVPKLNGKPAWPAAAEIVEVKPNI